MYEELAGRVSAPRFPWQAWIARGTAEMRRPGEEQLLKHDSEQQQGQGTNAAWRPRRVGHLETLLLVGLEAMVDVASMLWAEVGTTVHSTILALLLEL